MMEFDYINGRECVYVRLPPLNKTEFVDYKDFIKSYTEYKEKSINFYNHTVKVYNTNGDTRRVIFSTLLSNHNLKAYIEEYNPELQL